MLFTSLSPRGRHTAFVASFPLGLSDALPLKFQFAMRAKLASQALLGIGMALRNHLFLFTQHPIDAGPTNTQPDREAFGTRPL